MAKTARDALDYLLIINGCKKAMQERQIEGTLQQLRELLPKEEIVAHIIYPSRKDLIRRKAYVIGFNDCLAKVKEVLK